MSWRQLHICDILAKLWSVSLQRFLSSPRRRRLLAACTYTTQFRGIQDFSGLHVSTRPQEGGRTLSEQLDTPRERGSRFGSMTREPAPGSTPRHLRGSHAENSSRQLFEGECISSAGAKYLNERLVTSAYGSGIVHLDRYR
jgi:hypothetical protein